MKISRTALAASWCVAMVLGGCKSNSDFNEDVAREAIESSPMKLEGEQVTFTDAQIQCGVRSELWESPLTPSPDRTSARLTPKGRNLKFNDDVMVHDPSSSVPFVQVRGDFPLRVGSIAAIKDGEDKSARLVEARASVKIDDPCFQDPLPLMGIKHGDFSVDAPVVFHLHLDETGWHADKVVH